MTIEDKARIKEEQTHLQKIRQLMSKMTKDEASAACEVLYLKHPDAYVMSMLKINTRNNLHRDSIDSLVYAYKNFEKNIYGGET